MLRRSICRPALDEVGEVQYEMTDEDYAGKEVEDSWVQSLLAHLGHYLNALQPLLTPSNYQHLVAQLLEKVPPPCFSDLSRCMACRVFMCFVNSTQKVT